MIRTALVFVIVSASFASAQTYTWIGGGGYQDPRWSTPANWAGGVVPISSSESTILFSTGQNYNSVNDLSLNVGTIDLTFAKVSGRPIDVYHQVNGPWFQYPRGEYSDWQVNIAGDVRLVGAHPAPTPGSGPAQLVSALVKVGGSGSATFEGAWHIDTLTFSGDLNVAGTGLLSTYNGTANLRSVTANGIFDLTSDFTLPTGQKLDLTNAVVDLARSDLVLDGYYAGELRFAGDIALGNWMLGSEARNLEPLTNDRIIAGGTLDLTRSHVIQPYRMALDVTRPAYLVLARYGNRIGALDIQTINIRSPYPGGFNGTFPIVYTSAENAGPGEIRALLPEPSIPVTIAAGALLVRRRREE